MSKSNPISRRVLAKRMLRPLPPSMSTGLSLMTLFDHQLLHKIQPYCGIKATIGLFINKFHRWCLRICAGDFQLNLQQKWCGTIQGTIFRQIRTRHVSRHGLEGPPEQETDMPKANTRANDKWAQDVTHRPKEKVGGPTRWSADHPGWPTSPWAPPL